MEGQFILRVDGEYVALKEGDGLHIGDYYPRLVRETLKHRKPSDCCPFNAPGHTYGGPVIHWTDGYPWMYCHKQAAMFD